MILFILFILVFGIILAALSTNERVAVADLQSAILQPYIEALERRSAIKPTVQTKFEWPNEWERR